MSDMAKNIVLVHGAFAGEAYDARDTGPNRKSRLRTRMVLG